MPDIRGEIQEILEKYASDYLNASSDEIVELRTYEKKILDQATDSLLALMEKELARHKKALEEIKNKIPENTRFDLMNEIKDIATQALKGER